MTRLPSLPLCALFARALWASALWISALWISALSASGCGARTDLDVGDAAPPPPPDAAEPECRANRDCDDGVPCTEDRCRAGRCEHATDDALCDDGLFCTGVERCTPEGCRPGAPVACEDGVACTEDRCDPELDACAAEPRRERCPVSFRCDPERGCLASALVHDDEVLLEVDLPSGDLSRLGDLPLPFTDLALDEEGGLYGAYSGSLWAFDFEAGVATEVAVVGGRFFALESGPGGLFYGASDDRISLVDPVAGSEAVIARFPRPYRSSGDLALIGDGLYATATDERGTDVLFRVDLASSGPAVEVGRTGFDCIWGLAARGETLYGFTCEGLLIELDPERGLGRMLRRIGPRFFGAAAR